MIQRRQFITQAGQGFGGMALASMLHQEAYSGSGGVLQTLHHPPKAKRVVQLFMAGAASHLDLWDHKPLLERLHGQPSDFGEQVETFQDGLGPWMKSPFKFSAHGQCGKMLSEVVAPLGKHVDDIAFIHNMVGITGVHSQATLLQATGFQRPGFPGLGAWVSYALGSINDNLPTFVVLPDHRGFASNGPKNWSSAFLPASSQGTAIFPQREIPIEDLQPQAEYATPESDAAGLAMLNRVNSHYHQQRPGDSRLAARVRSYELAAAMQLSAPRPWTLVKSRNIVCDSMGLIAPVLLIRLR